MALKITQHRNNTQGLCHLVVDEDMTIHVIGALKQEISKELDSYDCFELNLAGIEEIDSAGIQLLLALRGELMRKKKQFKLSAMSAAVSKLIESYGLTDRFNRGDTT